VGVAVTPTAAEALAEIRRREVAVALVDLYLPDSEGTDLCHEIRAASPDTTVVLMTARPEALGMDEALAPVADDFFVKGNDMAELGRRVGARLEQHQSLRSVRQRERTLVGVARLAQALASHHDLPALLPALHAGLLALPGVLGARLELAPRTGEPAVVVLQAGAAAVESALAVPLHGARPGTLWLQLDARTALDAETIQALGGVVGAALRSARLFESLKERQARLERGYVERQRQLAQMGHRLDRLADARDSFLALLSHDLRTPIAVVLGNCQLLLEGLVPAAGVPKAVETIQRQSERMSQMVSDLLDRYRYGEGAKAEPEPADLADLARQACQTFEGVAQRKGQRIEISGERTLPIEARVPELREVFANLLENGLRYSPEGAVVRCHLSRAADLAEVRIQDEGPGFGDGSGGGSGLSLGLQACTRIVAEAGGQFRIGRAATGGAEVRFTIPLALAASATPGVGVFCADVDTLEAWTEALGAHFSLATATGAAEAVAIARAGNLDVVVLDWDLAGAGAEGQLLARLKEDVELAAIPVIAVGPGARPGWEALAHDQGALVTLRRPLGLDVLVDEVRRAMRIVAESRASVAGRAADTLTGLDTEEYAEARVVAVAEEARRAGLPLPAIEVEVNGMKDVNLRLGWEVGDQLLIWVANAVRRHARPGELCARIQGDAMLLVMPSRGMDEANHLAAEVAEQIGRAKPRLGVSRVPVAVSARVVDLVALPGPSPIAALRRPG
jgi:diguanylate cyclase (GGDEF)-like protein